MQLHHSFSVFLVLFFLQHSLPVLAADDHKSKSKPDPPCTLHSPNSGSFFDLRPMSLRAPKEGTKPHKDERLVSWHARGHDYPANFTLNICAPVIEDVKDVVGVDRSRWQNVSAYYDYHGKTYSIGQQSSEPIFRGRKLVLNYTDGSPCSSTTNHRRSLHAVSSFARDRDDSDDDDDDDDDDKDDNGRNGHRKGSKGIRRKSTLISLLCERDPLAAKAAIAFVGASPDECTYFFELRSPAACGGVSSTSEGLGPGGVFGVIAVIAILVYLIGGLFYQRTVMHARGWRQLPNYTMWAGIGSFFRDMFIILTSSCGRVLPRARGYRSLSVANGNTGGSRGNRSDDENRLIDQLDEEWED
ncbi:MAG: Cation-independent mannose-6-phosphate receptor CI-MPR [Caeruleum heppii]|nr:MAG: Cation-independent mannose-6-phosphate receptor CI-MPR [Caeruleum heppii]